MKEEPRPWNIDMASTEVGRDSMEESLQESSRKSALSHIKGNTERPASNIGGELAELAS